MREENRYIRGLISWSGFTHYSVSYEREINAMLEKQNIISQKC